MSAVNARSRDTFSCSPQLSCSTQPHLLIDVVHTVEVQAIHEQDHIHCTAMFLQVILDLLQYLQAGSLMSGAQQGTQQSMP